MHKCVVKLTTLYLVCKTFRYFYKVIFQMRGLEHSDTQKQVLYLQTCVQVGSYFSKFVRLITKHYKTEENICEFLIASSLRSTRLFSTKSAKLKSSKWKKWHMSLRKAPDCRVALSSSCGSWDSLSWNAFCLICKLIRRNVFPYRRTLIHYVKNSVPLIYWITLQLNEKQNWCYTPAQTHA